MYNLLSILDIIQKILLCFSVFFVIQLLPKVVAWKSQEEHKIAGAARIFN
jgi:hypothetical protein